MKDLFVAVITAVAAVAGLAVYVVKGTDYYCPQPSAASVATLFAPCQAFNSAMGRSVTKQEAVQMGLLRPDEQPAPTPDKTVADEHQIIAQEHATVGVANSKPVIHGP